MKREKGVKALYKRLDSVFRRENNPDFAICGDVYKELKAIMLHCHIYGVNISKAVESGDFNRLSNCFGLYW